MNTMNMIFMMMMLASASARMMGAPAPAVSTTRQETAVKFIKSCDTMRVSFLEYQGNKAYCAQEDWHGIVTAYSADLSTLQTVIYLSDDISYLGVKMSYTDTYVVLPGSIIDSDSVEYIDTLYNFLERNTNTKGYCEQIRETIGGNVYRLKEGITEFMMCGDTIINTPSPPPPSPPTPPPSPPSPSPQSSTGGVPLAAIIGGSVGAFAIVVGIIITCVMVNKKRKASAVAIAVSNVVENTSSYATNDTPTLTSNTIPVVSIV